VGPFLSKELSNTSPTFWTSSVRSSNAKSESVSAFSDANVSAFSDADGWLLISFSLKPIWTEKPKCFAWDSVTSLPSLGKYSSNAAPRSSIIVRAHCAPAAVQ
jgi:hypothetical protein